MGAVDVLRHRRCLQTDWLTKQKLLFGHQEPVHIATGQHIIEQARQLELIVAETSVDSTIVGGLLESLENICHSSCDALHQKLSAIDNHSRT